MKTDKRIKKLTVLAMFSALAYIAMIIIHIPVGGFLTFDPKDAVITIGAMFFGPLSGIVMSALVALCEMITISDTGPYGLIMNFISSAVFSTVAPLFYKKWRKISGAIVGLLCSVCATVAIMMIANLLLTPYYMGVSVSDVVGLIPTLLLPFNLTKSILNAALVLLLYKPLMNALRAIKLIERPAKKSENKNIWQTVLITLCALIVIICSIAIFVFVLGIN